MSNSVEKYVLSFTAASLRLSEMVRLAEYVIEGDIRDIAELKDKSSIVSASSSKTTTRIFSEIRKRINHLSREQLYILATGDLVSQKQIGFVAICKTYSFIRDFMLEVVREKFLVFDYKIYDSDYFSFLNSKIELHPELEQVTELTLKKVKQVLFLILEQVGVIDNVKDKNIQMQILDQRLINAVSDDNPLWLKVLLVSDKDIR